jgi:hypothetical protein
MSASLNKDEVQVAVVTGPDGRHFLQLVQDDAVMVIERLRETHADSLGRAYLIKLDTLIERLGQRWESKKDLVFEQLRSSFERKFPEPNWCIKINNDAFLMVILTLGEYRGALSAAEIWYSIGQFFIGDVSQIRPPLYEALADDVDRLRLIPIDLAKYFDRAEARPFGDAPRPSMASQIQNGRGVSVAPGSMITVENSVRNPGLAMTATAPADRPQVSNATANIGKTPINAGQIVGGTRGFRVQGMIEAVFEMKNLVVIGHRFESFVTYANTNSALDSRGLAALDWHEREQIDLETITQCIDLIRRRTPAQRKILMVVPAAFSTFASGRGRGALVSLVASAAKEMSLKVLFEMRNLNGVPMSRVIEIVSLLRPFCMTIIAHMGSDLRAFSGLKGSGVSGVCIDYDAIKRDDSALTDYLSGLSHAARASTGACMVRGFDNLHQVAVARLAGVSHATIKASTVTIARGPT